MKYAVILWVVVFTIGCGTWVNDNPEIGFAPLPNRALTVTPYPPQQGQPLTITYNLRDTTAAYRSSQGLFVQLIVNSYSCPFANYAVKFVGSDSSTLRADCIIPNDAYFVHVQVRKCGEVIPKEGPLLLPVFKGATPALGALPELLLSYSMDPTENMDTTNTALLFHEDASYYPEHYWRWFPIWQQTIRSERKPTAILSQVTALWKSEGVRQSISGAAVCMAGFAMSLQWQEAAACARALDTLLNRRQQAETVPLGILQSIYSTARAVSGAGGTTSHHAQEFERLLNALAITYPFEFGTRTIIIEHLTKANTTRLVIPNQPLRTQTRIPTALPESNATFRAIVSSWVRWLLQPSDNPAVLCYQLQDAAVGCSMALDELRDTATAVQLIETALKKLSSVPSLEDAPGCNRPVLGNKHGSVPSLLLHKARILLARNDPAGISTVHELVLNQPIEQYSRGPISLGCMALAEYYTRMRHLDSALKYWAWATQLESPFADSLWNRIRRLALSQGVSRIDRSTAIEQYPYPRVHQYQSSQIVTLELDDGTTVDPRTNPHPILLLFTSETCGLCKQWYPRLLDSIARKKLPATIVVLRPDSSTIPRTPIGIALAYASLTPEIAGRYRITGFPTVVVLVGDRVRYNSGCSSRQQVETILDVLAR